MGKTPWAVFLWPGLPFLYRGQIMGLVVAIAATVVLNVALLSTFVWIELLGYAARVVVWFVIALGWGAAAWWAIRTPRAEAPAPEPPSGQGFASAMQHYLRGDWFEAERLLVGLLARDEEDVESRLMLATLLRHRKRFDEALRHLEFLQGLETAASWHWEICRERQLLADAESRDETAGPLTTEITAEAEQTDCGPLLGGKPSPTGSCPPMDGDASGKKASVCMDCSGELNFDNSNNHEGFCDEAAAESRWGPSPKSLRVA